MNRYHWLILLAALTSFTGLFNQVFMADSALYASVAKSFALTGNYLDILVDGQDWLDKPHFSFWMEALSMELFGINSFAFKLPSFISYLLALFYIFLLGKKFYSKEVGLLAAMIFASSVHILISVNDVKVDAVLTGLIIAAVYHLYELTYSKKWRDILLSSVFMAAAIMTKGVFVTIIFSSAIFGYLLMKGKLKLLLHYKWLLVFGLTCLFIIPEIYAVYMQFDMHPEKLVFGKQNVSGVRFFFWGSQFGRFSNTGPITIGRVDPFYFLHTILWAFGPWSVIGYAAIIKKVRSFTHYQKEQEYLTFFGFMIMFLIFSVSGTQLAHYTNIIYPFLSIMAADFILNKMESKMDKRIFLGSLLLFAIAIPLLMILISIVFINSIPVLMVLLTGIAIASLIFIIYRREYFIDVLTGSVFSICCLLLFLNTCYYPELHRYQAGSQAAFYIEDHYKEPVNVAYKFNWLFQFYAESKAIGINSFDELAGRFTVGEEIILYADDALLNELLQKNIPFEEIEQFDNFRTSMINMQFFNHRTREATLDKTYLLSLKAH